MVNFDFKEVKQRGRGRVRKQSVCGIVGAAFPYSIGV